MGTYMLSMYVSEAAADLNSGGTNRTSQPTLPNALYGYDRADCTSKRRETVHCAR